MRGASAEKHGQTCWLETAGRLSVWSASAVKEEKPLWTITTLLVKETAR